MKTILVPIDLSAASGKICDAACELARQASARLVFLHVLPPPMVVLGDYYNFDARTVAEATAAAENAAKDKLKEMTARCGRRRIPIKTVRVVGPAAAKILAQAAALKAGYIVMGSHGHGAMFDLLVGSTTHGVLRKSKVPVLVVPIPEAGWKL